MKINDILQSFVGMPNNTSTRKMMKKAIDEMIIDFDDVSYEYDVYDGSLDITFDSEEALLMFKLRYM
jgi:hypothetical protein